MFILIVVFHFFQQSTSSVVAEFQSKEACQAASIEIQKQAKPQVVLCAAKGEKK